ncbi:hypothetical protein BamIOP4010DRAFT_4359 [Burkholderia ambifaria IOP40-10]|uniref:Uncharacterized protein n=2 Tax=Burkholderia ambifaria TaxID=152480 RepID=B1FJZ8_9BURK|nr:hypothetical protein BamIOP4010DRAFT_4359 [Burkholderia ambifaria IOP40-10]
MTATISGGLVPRAMRWLALERDPIRYRYRDSVNGDTAPHWKCDASRIMVRELAETALRGGESAQDALDVLLDIAFFRNSEVAAEAEGHLLDLYERVDLPLEVRDVFDRKLVAQCKRLVESSECAVGSEFALPAALGYLALHADITDCMPLNAGLRQDQREQLGVDLCDMAKLYGASLDDATRMVTNEEVANSVCRLDFGSGREWNVSADVQGSGARLRDLIHSWVEGREPVLYIPVCLTDPKHFLLLILERHAAGAMQATIVDTSGMLAHKECAGSATDATRQNWRQALRDMTQAAEIDDIVFYSSDVQEHISNDSGPLICRLADGLQKRAAAAKEDVRYAAGGNGEIITRYLNGLGQLEPHARQWMLKATRAKMLADQVQACRDSRFVERSELTPWD